VPSGAVPRTSLLASDGGRRAKATLSLAPSAKPAPPNGLAAGTIELDTVPRAGSYSGAVPLDDDESLKVKALVQDFILWPVLVVLLGASLGAFGTRAYAWRRSRTLLLGSLRDALECYWRERGSPPALGGAYDLQWPALAALPKSNQCKGDAIAIVDAARQVQDVWCAVVVAEGQEKSEQVTPDVAAVRTGLDRWLEVNFELQRLTAVVSEVTEHDLLPYEDSSLLAREMSTTPADEESRVARLVRMRQQANVVAAFVAAYAAWNVLDGRQWEAYPELDPRAIYRNAPREADRTETDTMRLLRALGRARDELTALQAAGAEQRVGRALGLPLLPPSSSALSALTAALSNLGTRKPVEEQTAAALMMRAHRWDALLQAATAVVTVLAYVLTVHGGHTYGQTTDYLSAIAVGLIGQLGSFSINWDRFRVTNASTSAAS
jgi:hypothetical protein